MPQDMAMEQPDARILSAEAKNSIPPTGDLNCISENGAGEIIWCI